MSNETQYEPLRQALGRLRIGQLPRQVPVPSSSNTTRARSLLGPRTDEQRLNEARLRLRHWADVIEEVMVSPVPFEFRVLMEKIEPKQEAAKRRQQQAGSYPIACLDKDTQQGREAKKVINGFYGVVSAFRASVEQALVDSRDDRTRYLSRQASWRVAKLHALEPQNQDQEYIVNSALHPCMLIEEHRIWEHASAEELIEIVEQSERMDESIEEVIKEFHNAAGSHRRGSSPAVSPHSQPRRRRSSSSSNAGSVEHHEFSPLERHSSMSLGKGHQHVPQLSTRQAMLQGVSEGQLKARYGY